MRLECQKDSKKLEGVLVARLKERSTGKLVGWNYRWNTGEIEPLWIDRPIMDVVIEPFQSIYDSRAHENK